MDSSNPSPLIVDTTHSPHARLKPVPLTAVKLADEFWAPRLRLIQEVALPAQYRQIVETGRLWNFQRAAGQVSGPFKGLYFNDSDVYKWLEAAAWTLAWGPDPALQEMVDTIASAIEAAQQPDGYLNSYFMFERAGQRWTDLRAMHELYCAGHFFQAAIAYRRATGSPRLLEVACRLADHICAIFGPGQKPGTPGHPEIELALVELYRLTGDVKYLEQAQIFLDSRGRGIIGGEINLSDNQPFRELQQLVGHAVRSLYLTAGAADLYAETGEDALHATLERLWEHMVSRQLYVTGGAGTRYGSEAFGNDWELPNARAYAETCAAIASVMWNWRMLQHDGEARYADLLEWTLYNAVSPGFSLDGLGYFYVNPLSNDGTHRRRPWFECACCPPNVARTLAILPSFFYSHSAEGIWVHLYATGRADLPTPEGWTLSLEQRTGYPWEGGVDLEIRAAPSGVPVSLFLRIPGWLEGGGYGMTLNGYPLDLPLVPGEYLEVRRPWEPGDLVHLDFPMPVRAMASHPNILENVGRVALSRGPILYCAEAVDNPNLMLSGLDLRQVALSLEQPVSAVFRPDQLGGVVFLNAAVEACPVDSVWEKALYRSLSLPSVDPTRLFAPQHPPTPHSLTLIPYYAWANRQPGQMQVWVKRYLFP